MTSEPLFNTIPHDLGVEQALLGILLFDSKAYARLEGIVTAQAFYEPFHQRLFAAIEAGARANRTVDAVMLAPIFEHDHVFDELGGLNYLADLVDRAPPSAGAADYARVISDLNSRRLLMTAGNALRIAAMKGHEPPARLIAQGEASLRDIARGTAAEDHWKSGADLGHVVREKLAGRRKASFLKTGYHDFDNRYGGIRRGRQTILAGRPAMGKSAVATCIGQRIAADGRGVGFFSLEMDDEENGLRMACDRAFDRESRSGPVYFDAMRDALSEEDKDTLHIAAGTLAGLPIHIDDRTGLNPGQIIPAAKRLIRQWEKARIEPGVIIIDHLHLVRPEVERYGNRAAEIGDVSGALRELAKETGVAVLTCCQLNREVENRNNKDKRPGLADLKGSGNIEEDANTVIFLYRPEYYLVEPEDRNDDAAMMKYMDETREWKDKIQLLIRKNRAGPNMKEHTMNISLPHNALWEEDGI